jgi:hypothetical protein
MTFEKCGKKHKSSEARSEALEKTHVSNHVLLDVSLAIQSSIKKEF